MPYSAFYGWGKKMGEFSTGWTKIFDPLQNKKYLVMLHCIVLHAFHRIFFFNSSTTSSGQKDFILLCWSNIRTLGLNIKKNRCKITLTKVLCSSGLCPCVSSLLLPELGRSQKQGKCASSLILEEWLLNVNVETCPSDLLVGGRSLDTETDGCTFPS